MIAWSASDPTALEPVGPDFPQDTEPPSEVPAEDEPGHHRQPLENGSAGVPVGSSTLAIRQ